MMVLIQLRTCSYTDSFSQQEVSQPVDYVSPKNPDLLSLKI